MAKILNIDPLSRVEGHLKIETEVDRGVIVAARIGGRMYRGLEHLLLGRHPVDAARITQRTCGICHEVHGVASILALEELYGIEPPPNGRLLRDLILGLHLVGDHLFHFYQLCLPDYADFSHLRSYQGKDPRLQEIARWLAAPDNRLFSGAAAGDYLRDRTLATELALSYFEALQVRREAASGLAILGGKVPFAQALMPGGLTTAVTTDKLMFFYRTLQKTRAFVENRYLPQILALAGAFRDYFSLGNAGYEFLSHASFTQGSAPLFHGGVTQAGTLEAFNPSLVAEGTEHAYYAEDGRLAADKPAAYSWIKTMHYQGRPMEVGPLARLAVNGDKEFRVLLAGFGERQVRSSVMARLLARALESKLICRHLDRLLELYCLGEPTIVPVDLKQPVDGMGRGFSIAARGALSHQIEARAGRVVRYQLRVPSAWNFGPAAGGHQGVVEAALIGASVTSGKASESLLAGRIVRSFDPCIACAVH